MRLATIDDQAIHTSQENDGQQPRSSRKRGRSSKDKRNEPSSSHTTGDNFDGEHPLKRPRKGLTFDEVYQNTLHTDKKNIIVEWPKKSRNFYIISPCTRCSRNQDWGSTPVLKAGFHLAGAGHNLIHGRYTTTVILELGIPVANCTIQLQKKNNDAYNSHSSSKSRGTEEQSPVIDRRPGHPTASAARRRDKPANKHKHKHKSRRQQGGGTIPMTTRQQILGGNDNPGPDANADDEECIAVESPLSGYLEKIENTPPEQVIVNPVPGQIYQAWWEDQDDAETGWYFTTPLPLPPKDLAEIGMVGHLFRSHLCSEGAKLPECYEKSGPLLTWAKDFEDGGPRVTERRVPLLFLTPGLNIPPPGQEFNLPSEMGLLAWMGVRRLRHESFKDPEDLQSRRTAARGGAVVEAFKARLEALNDGNTAGSSGASVRFPTMDAYIFKD